MLSICSKGTILIQLLVVCLEMGSLGTSYVTEHSKVTNYLLCNFIPSNEAALNNWTGSIIAKRLSVRHIIAAGAYRALV